MKAFRSRLWSLALCIFASASANAIPIYYEAEALGGNTWQYSYTVANDDPAFAVYEFTIFFDLGLYSNLRLASAPAGWDPIAIQPDATLPDDGFYDALALGGPLYPGELLSGFSIVFDYLGLESPGSQRYDIIDPATFETLSSGLTEHRASTQVPEPGTLMLLLMGLVGTSLLRRQPA
jgi:hypothetical protein